MDTVYSAVMNMVFLNCLWLLPEIRVLSYYKYTSHCEIQNGSPFFRSSKITKKQVFPKVEVKQLIFRMSEQRMQQDCLKRAKLKKYIFCLPNNQSVFLPPWIRVNKSAAQGWFRLCILSCNSWWKVSSLIKEIKNELLFIFHMLPRIFPPFNSCRYQRILGLKLLATFNLHYFWEVYLCEIESQEHLSKFAGMCFCSISWSSFQVSLSLP